MSSDHSRSHRYRVTLAPAIMDRFVRERGAWQETPDEARRRERYRARRQVLLEWVMQCLPRVLTVRERVCVDLYYFRGLNYREIGEATATNKTSAFRAVERALRKLREEKERDRSWEDALRELERQDQP